MCQGTREIKIGSLYQDSLYRGLCFNNIIINRGLLNRGSTVAYFNHGTSQVSTSTYSYKTTSEGHSSHHRNVIQM